MDTEDRFPGPATLRHHEATLGTLRAAGFSVAMTAHAYALLDSYMYGEHILRPGLTWPCARTGWNT